MFGQWYILLRARVRWGSQLFTAVPCIGIWENKHVRNIWWPQHTCQEMSGTQQVQERIRRPRGGVRMLHKRRIRVLCSCQSCTLNPFGKSMEASGNLSAGFVSQAGSEMRAMTVFLCFLLFSLGPMQWRAAADLSLDTHHQTYGPACVQTHIFLPHSCWRENRNMSWFISSFPDSRTCSHSHH